MNPTDKRCVFSMEASQRFCFFRQIVKAGCSGEEDMQVFIRHRIKFDAGLQPMPYGIPSEFFFFISRFYRPPRFRTFLWRRRSISDEMR